MSRKYKDAPILEALCEFRFDTASPWDPTIPGLIFGEMKEDFPQRRVGQAVESALIPDDKGVQHKVSVSARSQLVRGDEKAMIQVGEHLLAINRLAPYASWSEFLPIIKQGFRVYCQQAAPKGIVRIGLRYINLIKIPTDVVRLEDYFAFRPATPAALSTDVAAFICGVQVSKVDLQSTLKVELANSPDAEPGTRSFVLDLDHFTTSACAPEFDGVFAWLERAHTELETAFEACIQDTLRLMFREEA